MKIERLPLSRLACVNDECKSYGKRGLENLYVRKHYGKEQLRLLRYRHCDSEFSERRSTPFRLRSRQALWNCKLPEPKAMAIAEQLAEGSPMKGTARVSHPRL